MGHVVGLLRTQRNRLHPVVPLGARNRGRQVVERIAEDRQVKPIQVALAVDCSAVPDMLPITGTTSIVHLEENVQRHRYSVTSKNTWS